MAKTKVTAPAIPWKAVFGTVIDGIVQTIHDRQEGDYDEVYAWVLRIGTDRFFEILEDHDSSVRYYFQDLENDKSGGYDTLDELAEGGNPDQFYFNVIGPAVDRISDAYQAENPKPKPKPAPKKRTPRKKTGTTSKR